MGLEIEVKYPLEDFASVLSILREKGRLLRGRVFERNVVYDTAERNLRGQGKLLRLRNDGRQILTYKERPSSGQMAGFKVRRELETVVTDCEVMAEVLNGLGFAAVLSYEKYREVWECADCKVFLDELPFGKFLEIEGQPEAIEACAKLLGLEGSRASDLNYHQLYQLYLQSQGLPPCDSFVFGQCESK